MSSSAQKRKIVGSSSIGNPPKRLKKDIETLEYKVYNFADREEKRGERVEVPALQAHGHKWVLRVYPKGNSKSTRSTTYVSVRLYHIGSPEPAAAKISMRCKDFKKKVTNQEMCCDNFLKREDVLANYLDDDGTLVIEVDIQIAAEETNVWWPELDMPNKFLTKLYRSTSTPDSSADVTFRVGGKDFEAHTTVLSQCAKTMYEMVIDYRNRSDDGSVVVPISDMEGDVFEKILEFVYCVQTPEIKEDDFANKMLLAADRLGCTDL